MRKTHRGGTILKNSAFKHILSIGYEFETGDLAKMSLSKDGTTFINSDINLSILKLGLKNNKIRRIDNNHYEITMPPPPEPRIWSETADTVSGEPTASAAGGGSVATPPAAPEETFIEYIEEADIDGSEINSGVVLHVTADIGHSIFHEMIEDICHPHERQGISKNEMFIYKTTAGREYKINFAGVLAAQECHSISGTEWVITYYNTKQTNNIILNTYVDACNRILEHMSDLVKISGNLYFKDGQNTANNRIGLIENRIMFHKPNTNLYYLYTGDSMYLRTINYNLETNLIFKPQMTFRVNIKHVVPVMKEIIRHSAKQFKVSKTKLAIFKKRYDIIDNMDKMVGELLQAAARAGGPRISAADGAGLMIRNYLFMIFYKLCIFVDYYSRTEMRAAENYFKNYLPFSARNTNDVYYFRLRELVQEYFDIGEYEAAEVILRIVFQPAIIKKYMYKRAEVKPALKNIHPEYEDWGNPLVSYRSYFEHFENPYMDDEMDAEDVRYDWLNAQFFDGVVTSQLDLVDDNVIIENRFFAMELEAYMSSLGMIKFNFHNMRRFNALMLDGKKVDDYRNKRYNARTRKMVKKCFAGQIRNADFKCVRAGAKK